MSKVGNPSNRFSLSSGGLIGSIERWIRGSESPGFPIPTQIMIAFGLLWLPLAVPSLFENSFAGTAVIHPFITDVIPQARFLIAVPMLLMADLMIDPVPAAGADDVFTPGHVAAFGRFADLVSRLAKSPTLCAVYV